MSLHQRRGCQRLKRVNTPYNSFLLLVWPAAWCYINIHVGCFALLADFSAEMGHYFYKPPQSTIPFVLLLWALHVRLGRQAGRRGVRGVLRMHFYSQLKA